MGEGEGMPWGVIMLYGTRTPLGHQHKEDDRRLQAPSHVNSSRHPDSNTTAANSHLY